MYPIEYMCTKEEIVSTGISMDTVKESKLNPHKTFKDSESNHLVISRCTSVCERPISKKATKDKIVVIITDTHVINWEPVTPIFLPKNPDDIEANKGNIMIVKYII